MKSLTDKIQENTINEGLGTISLLAATTFFSVMMMVGAAAASAKTHGGTSYDDRSPLEIIKDDIAGFFKDKKLKKIADKYKDDPEIMEYVSDPKKKGWRKMLETKLEPDEIQYINSLTRTYFK